MSPLPGRAATVEIAWVVAGQAAAVIGSLALLRLLTTIMTPDEYGRLALGLTLAGLVGQVITGGVANGIGRFRSIAVESGDLDGFVNASRRLALGVGAVVLAGSLILAAALFLAGRPDWAAIVAWIAPFAIFAGWNQMLLSYQAAARRRPLVAVISAAEPWLRMPIALGLASWRGADAPTMIAALALASLATVLFQVGFVERVAPTGRDAEGAWRRRIVGFARPFTIFGIFTWLQQASDRWSLETFASTRDVAIFAVLYQVGYSPISSVSGLATAVLGPVLYQRAGDAASAERLARVRSTVRRLCAVILVLTVAGTGIAVLLADPVFAILVGPEFRGAAGLLPWLVATGGLFAAGQVLSLGLMAEVNTSRLIRPKVVTAVVGLALNIVGALWAGVTGVAIASTIFAAMFLAWVAILSSRPTVPEPSR